MKKKKIKKGQLKGEKYGRNYFVLLKDLKQYIEDQKAKKISLSSARKKELDIFINKFLKEYREAIEMLKNK